MSIIAPLNFLRPIFTVLKGSMTIFNFVKFQEYKNLPTILYIQCDSYRMFNIGDILLFILYAEDFLTLLYLTFLIYMFVMDYQKELLTLHLPSWLLHPFIVFTILV